jgi:hypothetical protein
MNSELISRCSFGVQPIKFTVLVTEISYSGKLSKEFSIALATGISYS